MLRSLSESPCVRRLERHRSAWCFALLVLGYLLYLVFGAVVFSSVELPHEDLLRQELSALKRRFLHQHACLDEPQLETFLARVLQASNYGVSVLSNASGNWNWDFASALFFASTVLSTTGRSSRTPPPRGLSRSVWTPWLGRSRCVSGPWQGRGPHLLFSRTSPLLKPFFLKKTSLSSIQG